MKMLASGVAKTTRRLAVVLVTATAILSFASCSETSGPDASEFFINPGSAEIFVGGDVQLTAVGAPSTPTWSSTNSQVASVIRETGFVSGISRGQASISAVAGSAIASIDVTVLQPPGIALSAATVDFDMTLGGSNPTPQTVTVQNSGDGTLQGVRIQSINYGAGQPTGWLTATASGSVAPATLALSANGSGLPRGTYTATVLVAADGVANSPQILAVTFGVLAPPQLTLSRTAVPMAGIPNSTANATVDVINGGDRPLTGLATTVLFTPGQPVGWLTATLDGTTAPTTMRLTAATTGLPVGTYNATIRVTSTETAFLDAVVTLIVSPGPSIVLSQTTVPFQTATGQNPANQTVNITNGGGGTLSGLSTGTISYTGGATGWLTATLGGGTAPTTITLAVAGASLPLGNYTATVPVLSAVASNSPLNLMVTLNVGPPPVIALSTSPLFSGWSGGFLPPQQAIQVTNSAPGQGPLPGLSFTVTYGTGATGWLAASWQSGNTSAPATLLVRPNTANLPVGNYTATVMVSSTVPGVASKTATVTYQMRAFSVEINPSLGGCLGCHSGGQVPVLSSNASSNCSALKVPPFTPGDGFNSKVYRVLAGLTFHTGGTNWGSLPNVIRQWIDGGAPCT